MKIKQGVSAERFLAAARQCTGAVTLVTDRGDRFELHSDLAGLLVAILGEEPERLYSAEVLCADESDQQRLRQILE